MVNVLGVHVSKPISLTYNRHTAQKLHSLFLQHPGKPLYQPLTLKLFKTSLQCLALLDSNIPYCQIERKANCNATFADWPNSKMLFTNKLNTKILLFTRNKNFVTAIESNQTRLFRYQQDIMLELEFFLK